MGTIAEKLTYLEGTKSAIKDAIIAKGVEVADTDTFRSYAEKIESIEAGGSCESQSKEINITDNGTRVVTPDEGYLLDQVTVTTNVTTGKPELPNGISFEGSTWTTFDTDPYDWSQVYSGTNMFKQCSNLQTLTGTGIENVYFLDLYSTFFSCTLLTTIPKLQGKPTTLYQCFGICGNLENPDLSGLDFSDTVDISYAFTNDKEWVQNIDLSAAPIRLAESAFTRSKITTMPNINTSLLENCKSMFQNCLGLTSATIDLPRAITVNGMFNNCQNLTDVNITGLKYCEDLGNLFYDCISLKNVGAIDCGNAHNINGMFGVAPVEFIGGLNNLGGGFISNTTLQIISDKLTRESCLNIFNTIYDFIGNGSNIRGTIDLNSAVLALLSEEDIAIATAKGWTVQ